MKIGIDARMIHSTGIGVYIRFLLHELAALDRKNSYVVFTAPQGRTSVPVSPAIEVRTTGIPIYSLREQFILPGRFSDAGCDLIHIPHYNVPTMLRGPLVVTIHDLIHKIFPQFMGGGLRNVYSSFLLNTTARKARMILADSEWTKRDIQMHLGVPPERIKVVSLAVSPHFRVLPAKETNTFRRAHGLDFPYLLSVGNSKPHKNLARLVRAFAAMKPGARGRTRLVLFGKADPRYPEAKAEAALQGVRDSVIFLESYLSDRDLVLLYNGAIGFVFPSLYEGFGLPPLEAMACGVPVLSSDGGSLPEVLGQAALLVSPYQEQDMARGIERLLGDRAVRTRLKVSGSKQVQKYSWKECARQTLRAYEEVHAS